VLRASRKNTPPEPRATRTNKDWVMIFLGMALILFFLGLGCLTVSEDGKRPAQRIRGPVKDPRGAVTPESVVAVSFPADESQRRNSSLLRDRTRVSDAVS